MSHSGRIGFVTGLIQAGVSIDIVSKMVGHKQITTTQRYDQYTVPPDKARDLLNKTFVASPALLEALKNQPTTDPPVDLTQPGTDDTNTS
jgi:hypothetical protein